MIKKILILLFLLLITAYLIVAVTAFNTKPADQVCKGMELIIKDSIDHGFISQKEVLRLLNGKKLSPVGKKMGDINTRLLEEELSQHPLQNRYRSDTAPPHPQSDGKQWRQLLY